MINVMWHSSRCVQYAGRFNIITVFICVGITRYVCNILMFDIK